MGEEGWLVLQRVGFYVEFACIEKRSYFLNQSPLVGEEAKL